MKTTCERRMGVPQPDEPEQVLHERLLQRPLDLAAGVEVAIDVAPDARLGQQLHIIAANRIVESAVDLINIQIGGGCAGGETTLSGAVEVNALDELIELRRWNEPRRTTLRSVRAD